MVMPVQLNFNVHSPASTEILVAYVERTPLTQESENKREFDHPTDANVAFER